MSRCRSSKGQDVKGAERGARSSGQGRRYDAPRGLHPKPVAVTKEMVGPVDRAGQFCRTNGPRPDPSESPKS